MLFFDMGGAELGCGRWSAILCRIGGLVVSVPASGSSGPSSSLTCCSIFRSRNVNHETFPDIPVLSARREGGIVLSVNHEQFLDMLAVANLELFSMYIAFWQLHSHLYLEKFRVIWDSVVSL